MKQRYVTKSGNWNEWWDKHQLIERVTVRSYREAIQYVADRNDGHDVYFGISRKTNEGYLQTTLDDRLVMFSAGPLSSGEPYDVLYAEIDWDLLIYWPHDGPPVRVDLTFDPEAPALNSINFSEAGEFALAADPCLLSRL